MPSEASYDLLSTRGAEAAAPSGNQQLFDVWSNLYDAETNPDGYVSLGVAENALMHTEMTRYIKDSFDLPETALTYGEGACGSKRLRAAISHFVNRHFEPVTPVKAEHVNVSNGVTTSIEGCAFALGNEGDGFLLGQPYYGSFPYDLGDRAGIRVVGVQFWRRRSIFRRSGRELRRCPPPVRNLRHESQSAHPLQSAQPARTVLSP